MLAEVLGESSQLWRKIKKILKAEYGELSNN